MFLILPIQKKRAHFSEINDQGQFAKIKLIVT